MIDPAQLRDYVLMNVTDPEHPKKLDDVAACIAAHEERESVRTASLQIRRRPGKRGRE